MISVAGTLVADVIIRPIRAWPGKSQNARVDRIEVLPGGAVANTGLALARLGVPVSTCAAVGEDNLGKIVKDSIGRWAARDAVTVLPSRRTTASLVAVSADGDRCFLSAAGACEQFTLTLGSGGERNRLRIACPAYWLRHDLTGARRRAVKESDAAGGSTRCLDFAGCHLL